MVSSALPLVEGKPPQWNSLGRAPKALVAAAICASLVILMTSGGVLRAAELRTSSSAVAAGVTTRAPGLTVGLFGFDADPLGLIKRYEVTSGYGLTPDSFEVWICEIPSGDQDWTPEAWVEFLTEELVPFLAWQSDNNYQITFRAGDTVKADDQSSCKSEVVKASRGGSRGALIIHNRQGAGAGLGSPGYTCYGPGCEFPSNRRVVTILSGVLLNTDRIGVVLDSLENGFPSREVLFAVGAIGSFAHEIGHAIALPHSFTGLRTGFFAEYDNPMDNMSSGPWGQFSGRRESAGTSVLAGTVAVNRYAAGWIAPDQVEIYKGGQNFVHTGGHRHRRNANAGHTLRHRGSVHRDGYQNQEVIRLPHTKRRSRNLLGRPDRRVLGWLGNREENSAVSGG